ncbi:divalent-cation tolerance protein CutA [Sulfuriroseicoccus oceanibius]|uniref:Divalent-cation tolerance protein CutA n=1 Tax=Sulfuriroseicoccus oceanibius TaxID=2707525 RepID=A0A6B3LDI8_9BACT|nr:divalent-cation tolerance protein CutA [Sulfuriroseicoccus oceanibius]QQL45327.1 divalent-cation tolerance protein CutA [Sulfuriroseicoccus oceanibius]
MSASDFPPPLLAVTTFPSDHIAREIASVLIDQKLAACVNLLPGATSIYRWQDQVHADDEIVALIKTTSAVFSELKLLLNDLHPYDSPELIAINIEDGLPDYLGWIVDETSADRKPADA